MTIRRVLIAGAGPVGMTAALVLSRAGIPVTVFERDAGLAEDLRASTWHPPTLDMMGELGLIARYTQHRDRKSGAIAEFDMELLRGETDHPYRVQYEQFRYTRLLQQRLAAFPDCRVVFNAKAHSLTQDGDQVLLSVETPNGIEQHRGDYLIGADGSRSEHRFSRADVSRAVLCRHHQFRFRQGARSPVLRQLHRGHRRVVRASESDRQLALPVSDPARRAG
jgi:3-(3-hydroxy-phenyl)propionate hydroxylase